MKESIRISNREIVSRITACDNCVRNTMKTFKTTGEIQSNLRSRRPKK